MVTPRRRYGWMHTVTATLILVVAAFGAEPPDNVPASPALDSISSNAMTFNAMTFNALMMHPSERLANYSLAEVVAPGSVFEPELATDPYAREFMEYLVSCALEEGDSLRWSSGAQTETWAGSLGLCPAWGTAAPDEACQELVSACLLARTNAYGESVEISLRGLYTDDTPLPLGSTETVDFPWQEGAFFGNVFCEECIDPSLEIVVSDKLLYYRYFGPGEFKKGEVIDVACDPFVGQPEQEVLWLRNECHWRFLQATSYQGVVYRAMFACWSPVWDDGQAYTLRRICAGVTSHGGYMDDQKQCAAWPVGACTTASPSVPCPTDHICDVGDSLPRDKDWDVDECAAMPMPTDELPAPGTCPAPPPLTAPTWHHPLTVFLDEPCAIVPDDGCRQNLEAIDPQTGGPRWPHEETRER